MTKFKAGDKVRYIKNTNIFMKKNKTYEIERVKYNSLNLKNVSDISVASDNFEPVNQIEEE